jgi:hypothetical protein
MTNGRAVHRELDVKAPVGSVAIAKGVASAFSPCEPPIRSRGAPSSVSPMVKLCGGCAWPGRPRSDGRAPLVRSGSLGRFFGGAAQPGEVVSDNQSKGVAGANYADVSPVRRSSRR